MSGPISLSQLPLWDRHESRVLGLLRDALLLLARDRPTGGEVEISRHLYMCILRANRENQGRSDNWFDYPPIWEGKNPPHPDTEREQAEKKIPDFQWGYIDHQERDPERSARHFTIECKRLGIPTKNGWAFNLHYVEDGIRRFCDVGHRYGNATRSGAMVGYVESMTIGAVLREVNSAAATLGIAQLRREAASGRRLYELRHEFDRAFEETPFRLTHLWVDLRARAAAPRQG